MSQAVLDQYQKYVIANYNRYPVVLVRGEGSRVWDDQGTPYLDFLLTESPYKLVDDWLLRTLSQPPPTSGEPCPLFTTHAVFCDVTKRTPTAKAQVTCSARASQAASTVQRPVGRSIVTSPTLSDVISSLLTSNTSVTRVWQK